MKMETQETSLDDEIKARKTDDVLITEIEAILDGEHVMIL